MTLLYRFRLRTFAISAELGNLRAACRAMGIHPSTYYRWKRQLDRHGSEILRPRERRVPRMANATRPLVEQRVVAFALGHPGFGLARIAAELARPKWGGIALSTNGVWRVLRRHGLSTRAKRYGLVAGYAAPPEPQWPAPPPERHLDVEHPGQLVQLDCFCIGRLSGTKGTVWQYTAIDVASAYAWASLQVTRRNPSAVWTSQLARTVAAELAKYGWKLERVMNDNASEFRSATFGQTIAQLGARHTFIRAWRPQTNGCVERVQQTILEECWKPAFARYLIPEQTGLRLDLERYLHYYNTERAHTGRWTKGRTPQAVLGKAKLWQKKLMRRHNSETGNTIRPDRMAGPLPGGFRVVLDRRARRLDGGRVLLGGSPLRLFRLSPDGRRLLDRLVEGATVEAASLAVGAAGGRLARTLVDTGILHPRPPAGFDPGPVDAVIPVRDRAGSLPGALAGLGNVRRVVVVDDGSVDASGAVARRLGAEVIRHARPQGPAAARNSGLRAVGGDLVALVDSDCVPEPDWLEALLPHFADPAVAAVAPRIGGRRLATGTALARYESVRSAVDLAAIEGRVRWHSRVAFVPTAAMVVRRQAVLDVGGFDEALWLAEDVDLVWRLTMAGWTIRYEPACRVHHEHRKRLGPMLARRAAYGYSAGALSRRHPGKVVPVQLSAWSALAWGLAAAGAPAVGVAVAVATSARMARGLRGLDHPGRVAARLAGLGHLRAGRLLATAVMRAWLPAALVAATRSRRARMALAASALVPAGLDWLERRPALDPIRYGTLRVLDDAAYCAGLWVGCLVEGTVAPLLPDLTGLGVPAPVRQLLRGARTRPPS